MAVGNIPNSLNAPPIIPHAPPPGVGEAGSLTGPAKAGDTQGVRPPGGLSIPVGAGEVSYSSPNLEGIDWDALTSDYNNVENLSISITAIMVLMIDVMKEMRKGQREAWMDEAQNALQMGMNAASQMRESAAAKLASDVVSNAASIVTAAISLGTSASSIKSMGSATKAIELKADALFGPKVDVGAQALKPDALPTPASADLPELEAPSLGSTGSASGTSPAAASPSGDQGTEVPQAAVGASADTPLTTSLETPASPSSSAGPSSAQTTAAGAQGADAPSSSQTSSPSDGAQGGAKTTNAAATKSEQQIADLDKQKAREMYVSQQKSLAESSLNNRINIAKSVTEIGAALAKIGGSVGEYFAGVKQAEAKEYEALGAYSQALMQAELEFANQMRDAIRNVLDTMKGAEQAKHQAMQGIYNI